PCPGGRRGGAGRHPGGHQGGVPQAAGRLVGPANDATQLFLELGGLLVLVAALIRLANRLGVSPIPLYLLAGLAFGTGGLVPLGTSREFIQLSADIGVVLLLLLLGLEYTADELSEGLRSGWRGGLVDLAL